MPKQVYAQAAQDEQEERQVRKLAGSHHAPADWKFHAQMVVESWAGKTPKEIAVTGIVNLFFSPDEFSPLRGFLGLFHGDSSRKEAQRTSLFPTFREK